MMSRQNEVRNLDKFQQASDAVHREAVERFASKFRKQLQRHETKEPTNVRNLYDTITLMWIHDDIVVRRNLQRFVRKYMPGSKVIDLAKEERRFSGG